MRASYMLRGANMGYVDIVYEKENGIAWITVNRPQVYNAMRARTNREMTEALLDAGSDNSIRVVVLAGAGPNAFGAGQDQSFDNPDPRDDVGHTVLFYWCRDHYFLHTNLKVWIQPSLRFKCPSAFQKKRALHWI